MISLLVGRFKTCELIEQQPDLRVESFFTEAWSNARIREIYIVLGNFKDEWFESILVESWILFFCQHLQHCISVVLSESRLQFIVLADHWLDLLEFFSQVLDFGEFFNVFLPYYSSLCPFFRFLKYLFTCFSCLYWFFTFCGQCALICDFILALVAWFDVGEPN